MNDSPFQRVCPPPNMIWRMSRLPQCAMYTPLIRRTWRSRLTCDRWHVWSYVRLQLRPLSISIDGPIHPLGAHEHKQPSSQFPDMQQPRGEKKGSTTSMISTKYPHKYVVKGTLQHAASNVLLIPAELTG